MNKKILIIFLAYFGINISQAQEDISEILDDGRVENIKAIAKIDALGLLTGDYSLYGEAKVWEYFGIEGSLGLFKYEGPDKYFGFISNKYLNSNYIIIPDTGKSLSYGLSGRYYFYQNYFSQNYTGNPRGTYLSVGYNSRSFGITDTIIREDFYYDPLYHFNHLKVKEFRFGTGAQFSFNRLFIDLSFYYSFYKLFSVNQLDGIEYNFNEALQWNESYTYFWFQAKIGYAF